MEKEINLTMLQQLVCLEKQEELSSGRDSK